MNNTKAFTGINIPFMPIISSIKYVHMIIDTSGSTRNLLPIYKKHISEFIERLKKINNSIVYVSITTFSKTPQLSLQPTNVKEVDCSAIKYPDADGPTYTGEALLTTIDMAMNLYYKDKSTQNKLKVFSPLLVLFSDGKLCAGLGASADEIDKCNLDYNDACKKIKSYEHNNYNDEFTFIAVGLKGSLGNSEKEELQRLTSHYDRVIEISDAKEMYTLFQKCVYYTIHNTFPSEDYTTVEI